MDGGPDPAVRASARQGVREIGQRRIVMCRHPISQPTGGAPQFLCRGGGQRKQQWSGYCSARVRARGPRAYRLGSLLQDGVNIGSRQSIRRNRRPARTLADRRPRRILLRHKQFRGYPSQFIWQTGEMQIPRNRPVLQCQDRLDQADGTGGRLGVAEVRFHRSEGARPVEAVHLTQAGVLNGVTERSAGAVRLNHPDGSWVHARGGKGRPVHRGLGGAGGRGDVHGVPAVVGGRAADDSEDPVTVAQSIR